MKKDINYLIEYLAKSEDKNANLYKDILSFFSEHLIYTSSSFKLKSLKALALKDGVELADSFDAVLKQLDSFLEENIDKDISEAKKQLLETILSSNFKKKKEEFDKVETSIYKCLTSYIFGLCRGLEIYYIYAKENIKEPELFIEYGSFLHVKLLNTIFNKEEKALLEEKLKELMGVYLSLYARYLYV